MTKKVLRRRSTGKPHRIKPPGSKSATPPPPPPKKSGLAPADLDMLFELYHSAVDVTMREGLRRVLEFSKEITDGGALTSFIADKREEAIEAIKAFPDVDPFDPRAVTTLQTPIRAYLDAMKYLIRLVEPFSRLSRMEGGDDLEDDGQEHSLGVAAGLTPDERDSDQVDDGS